MELSSASAPEDNPAHAFQAVHLEGSCSVNGGADTPCAMMGLAFDSGIVLSSVATAFADEVILSLSHLGLQKAVVSRVFEGGFEVHFAQASYPRIWAYLDWLSNAVEEPGQHGRGHERIVPLRKLVGLGRPGEPQSLARIVDLSQSGVALTTSNVLRVDEPVIVGRHAGRVTRVFQGGAAVQFDAAIPAERFDAMIDLSAD